ncbi:unnamed protein product, partial [Dovyalis caffra]
ERQSIDFKKIDVHVHRLKGDELRILHYTSIGAKRVKNDRIPFRRLREIRNIEG